MIGKRVVCLLFRLCLYFFCGLAVCSIVFVLHKEKKKYGMHPTLGDKPDYTKLSGLIFMAKYKLDNLGLRKKMGTHAKIDVLSGSNIHIQYVQGYFLALVHN